MKREKQKGFTLLEILLVIAAIGILAAIVLVAINPNKQIEAARTAQRRADINSIAKAVQQFIIDNGGSYPVGLQNIPVGASIGLCSVTCSNGINLSSSLSPIYIASIPVPPDANGQYTVTKTANGVSAGYDSAGNTAANIAGNPNLDINFARDKMLFNSTGSIPISFSRGETNPTPNRATYVGSDGLLKTAAANEPRFDHNPITGESLGLLVEEARTNNVLHSAYNVSSWAQSVGAGLSVQTGLLAPDGSNTAVRFINTGPTYGYTRISFPNLTTSPTGISYTVSFYAKLNAIPSNNGVYNTDIGDEGGLNYYSSLIVGQWVRITRTVNKTDSSLYKNFADIINGGTADWDITIWGAQVEAGSSATSLIITIGAANTRPVDNANITGDTFNTFYTRGPGSLYTEAYATLGIDQQYLTISTAAGSLRPRKTSTNNYSLMARDGSTRDAVQVPSPSLTNNQLIKIASAYNDNDVTVSGGGQSIVTASVLTLAPYDRLDIGPWVGGVCPSCTIRRVTYWPSRLSNTILSNLSR